MAYKVALAQKNYALKLLRSNLPIESVTDVAPVASAEIGKG